MVTVSLFVCWRWILCFVKSNHIQLEIEAISANSPLQATITGLVTLIEPLIYHLVFGAVSIRDACFGSCLEWFSSEVSSTTHWFISLFLKNWHWIKASANHPHNLPLEVIILPNHHPFYDYWVSKNQFTLPPIIMLQWKMGPGKMRLDSKGVILHFQDCWEKCTPRPKILRWFFRLCAV